MDNFSQKKKTDHDLLQPEFSIRYFCYDQFNVWKSVKVKQRGDGNGMLEFFIISGFSEFSITKDW